MNKASRKNILIVCVLLTVACLAIAILASQKMSFAKNDLNEERYLRMVAEEKLEKSKSKIHLLEGQVQKVQKEAEGLEALLREDKGAIADLKINLEKAHRLNDILQRELQNVLVTQPDPGKKK
ncbi:MAG: hypothetical protein P9M07_04065 [Candidatus Aceula meridiana]|nr:hypothetical protein [Candidatus Aceula meridiana]